MEQKLNIAEILRNKPEDTKLYSPIFGECVFCYIKDETNDICVKTQYDKIRFFDFEGLYNAGGECLLFPSKEMRDWSRFAWKRGDILADNDGETMVIFDKWYDDTYTSFYCKHYFNCEDKNHPVYYSEFLCTTEKYFFKNNQYANHDYLKAIEEKLGGKLNRETLEIEKQPKFKDGDIVCISGMGYLAYGIVKSIDNSSKKLEYYVLNDMSTLKFEDWLSFEDKQMQPITETQQIILFDALKKEGKAWDAVKKQIVDLKPKCKFKPFDKVLCRDWDGGKWGADFFSHYDESSDYPFICIKGVYKQCIPYSDMTRHLLGITGEWKG